LPELAVVIPDKKTLEFKEALIFGLLGVLKLRGEINTLSIELNTIIVQAKHTTKK
jgi:anhydro-N-acetylmuramic acid kinase